MLINRLTNHIIGRIEMSPTQLAAIQTLLRKCLPDLSAVAHTGTVQVIKAEDLTDDGLAHIASRGSNGTAEASNSEEIPSELH
jgi:hypothetical protein